MKFCQQSTQQHPKVLKYQNVLKNLYTLLENEGCDLKQDSPFCDKTYIIIDGDKVEDFFCIEDNRNLSSKNKSVDLIFAINGLNSKELQFVELKLNCGDKFHHLDKTSFRQKIDSSKRAMGNYLPFANKHLIVFHSSVLNQAKNFLFRLNPRLGNDFIAINVFELHNKFFV